MNLSDMKPNVRGRLHEIFCNINHDHERMPRECAIQEQLDEAMLVVNAAIVSGKTPKRRATSVKKTK